MSLTTCEITLAGLQLTGAKDDTSYYVLVPELEQALGWRLSQARQKIASESLKAFAGKELRLVKKKDSRGRSRGYVNLVSARDLMVLIGWEASNGNTKASALLIALAVEAVERRIDHALNVVKPEEDYESQTRSFFRELARKHFRPDYCEWLKQYEVSPCYGAEVKRLKHALNLPVSDSIDTYNTEQMQQWSNGLARYDGLRLAGFGHKRALQQLKLTTEARA